MQVVVGDIVLVLKYMPAYVVQALKGSYRCRADSNGLAVVLKNTVNRVAADRDILCMHVMPADFL